MNPSNFSSSLNWNSYFLAAKIFSTKEEVIEKHFGNFISEGDKWIAPQLEDCVGDYAENKIFF
jgi:hypothetical protein